MWRSGTSEDHTGAGANDFLREKYIGEFNVKFSVAAEEKGTAFRRTGRSDLNRIFTVQTERVVAKDNTVAVAARVVADRQDPLSPYSGWLYGDDSGTSGRDISTRYGPRVTAQFEANG